MHFIIDISETIASGLILTLVLFYLNEFVFPRRNLTGEWDAEICIVETSYTKYKNLRIEYKIHLIQKGYEISGSGEKIKDIKPDGTQIIFEREKRVNIYIDGYYERKYFQKSKVYLNILEDGRKRKTRATYCLKLERNNCIVGTFQSTAANTSGKAKMIKT
ncbi:MAG TPA: hypothetical protein VK787_10720 [Puia sp.]|jgi:hypothetical protein|nr:hypothetical protein [Puia sp.]